ncbi:MAG: tyrosine-type recombinase/integrase [Immundisolibacterales bacterium]|nr:tyrosine-type recombinase/integrase [Immundisolibacterales bacterium]
MKRLTSKFVAAVTEPGKYHDGDAGLYLYVQAHTSKAGTTTIRKSYLQRLTIDGKRVDIGLGSVKWTTPSEARAKAQANRKIARTGGDPRRNPERVPTFAEGVEAVLALQRPNWRDGGKSEKQWRASLRDYAGPLMTKRVSAITAHDVLAVVGPIWNDKRETARRVLQRIGAVLKWAVAGGHRDATPIEAVRAALPKNGAKRKHHRALPHAEVRGALETIRASQAWPSTRLALEFVVLTAARSGEVRGMRWDEVSGDVWTIPGSRTKAGREHRVPLPGAALAVLEAARELSDCAPDSLVFPSQRGRALSDMTLSKAMKDRGIDAVPHGFRSSFRDWCGETGIARDVAEAALAHVVKDKAEAAYARSDLLERRADVMERWARYVTGERAAVVRLSA